MLAVKDRGYIITIIVIAVAIGIGGAYLIRPACPELEVQAKQDLQERYGLTNIQILNVYCARHIVTFKGQIFTGVRYIDLRAMYDTERRRLIFNNNYSIRGEF